MRFTPRTALLLALASPIVFVAPLALMLSVIAAIVAAATVDALAVRRAPLGRREVGSFARGTATPVDIEVERGAASRVLIRQPLPPDVRSAQATSNTAMLRTTLVPQRRGAFTLPAVSVRRDGPLGLGRWHHVIGAPQPARVYPDLPAAHRIAQAVRQRSIRIVGDRRRGPLGLGTEFESVREYRPDDDARQINWRASSRLGRAMSNNLRVEQDLDVWVLVDAGRLSAASMRVGASLVTRLDLYLDATAAVGLVADDLSDRLGFSAFADRPLTHAVPRRRGGKHAIEASFAVEPVVIESDYATVFASTTSLRRALVLLFTDLIDESSAAGLAAALPGLSRRHSVIVLTIDDPEFVRARTNGTEAERLVMADIDAASAQARRMISATGASVVTLPADQLAEHSVRTYLKARTGGSAAAAVNVAR